MSGLCDLSSKLGNIVLASFLVLFGRRCKSEWLLVLCGILMASFLCMQVLGLYIFFKAIVLLDYIHICIHIVQKLYRCQNLV